MTLSDVFNALIAFVMFLFVLDTVLVALRYMAVAHEADLAEQEREEIEKCTR